MIFEWIEHGLVFTGLCLLIAGLAIYYACYINKEEDDEDGQNRHSTLM